MVVAGVGHFAGVEEDVLDSGYQAVEEFGSLRVVEERAADGGDLNQTRQRQRTQRCVGEAVVQVEKQLVEEEENKWHAICARIFFEILSLNK